MGELCCSTIFGNKVKKYEFSNLLHIYYAKPWSETIFKADYYSVIWISKENNQASLHLFVLKNIYTP